MQLVDVSRARGCLWGGPHTWFFLLACSLALRLHEGSKTDDVIDILWLAPSSQFDDGVRATFNASSSMPGLALAIDRVRREEVMQGWRFNVTWVDSECYAKTAVGVLTNTLQDLNNLPDVILGPPCTAAMQTVADLGSYFNIPVFGWMSSDHRLDNKTRASTLVRVMPPLSDLGNLLLYICSRFGWTRVAMISAKDPITNAVSDFFKELLRDESDFYLVRHFSNVDSLSSDAIIIRRLILVSEDARIVFLVLPESEIRRYMLHAHDLGMTSGDYQFLYVQPYISDDDEVDKMRSRESWRRLDGRDEEAKEAYRSLLIVTHSFIISWSIDYPEAEEVTNRIFADYRNEMPLFSPPDRYSRFLHDAFYLFCLAYNHTVASGLNTTGDNIFDAVTKIRFTGLTGDVHMNDKSDRLPHFLLWDLGPDSTFRIVTQVKYDSLRGGTMVVNFTERNDILWGDGSTWWSGSVPSDIPVCGFNNEKCPSDKTLEIVLPAVLSVTIAVAAVVFIVVFRLWKKGHIMYRKNWRIEWSDITFMQPGLTRPQEAGKLDMGSISATLSENASSSFTPSSGEPSHCESQKHHCKTAYIRGNLVSIHIIRCHSIKLDRRVHEDMRLVNKVRHSNMARFYGACVDPPSPCVLWEYCAKGSISDIIHNNDFRLDSMFQFSVATDIAAGIQFLHASELKVHGNLRSTNCLVDSRWTCKLSGFGLRNLLKYEKLRDKEDDNSKYSKLFWTAPETLRRVLRGERRVLTQAGDIFSIAILLKEILCKNSSYEDEIHMLNMSARDVVLKVAQAEGESYFRPKLSDMQGEQRTAMVSFVRLIQSCWAEDPVLRPSARRVYRLIKRINPFQTTGIMDNMLKLMERYSARLENLVGERTAQLAEEKRKTDSLLYRMLPHDSARAKRLRSKSDASCADTGRMVVEDLKSGRHVQAELFPSVTVYFSDIVGFTAIANESTPMQIIDLLNLVYRMFDNAIQDLDVYKVETIGDAYMVVSGLPLGNGLRHASIMADMALSLLRGVLNHSIPHQPGKPLRVRIGLNTGPVVAGVVGITMPRYCLFGNTVNLASRMESHGLSLKIQMSHSTYESIEDKSLYIITERGEITIKGKGQLKTYWLEGKVEVDKGPIDTHSVTTRTPSTAYLHNARIDDGGSTRGMTRMSVRTKSLTHQQGERVHAASCSSTTPTTTATATATATNQRHRYQGEEQVHAASTSSGSTTTTTATMHQHRRHQQPEGSPPGIPVSQTLVTTALGNDSGSDSEPEPELFEKEATGINILRRIGGKSSELTKVDGPPVLH